MDETKPIIITGNPVDGFTFYGPFEEHEKATTWAEEQLKGEDWWTGELHPPEGVEK